MVNFTTRIPGEAEPRSFRYDVLAGELYTDMEVEDPRGGMSVQKEQLITADSAQTNASHELYWNHTYTQREAYRLCEEEDISLDAALEKVTGQQLAKIAGQQEIPAVSAHPPPAVAPVQDTSPPGADPMVGVVITNQQLLLKMAFKLLDQHVAPEAKDYELIALLKEEAETLNGYEITI